VPTEDPNSAKTDANACASEAMDAVDDLLNSLQSLHVHVRAAPQMMAAQSGVGGAVGLGGGAWLGVTIQIVQLLVPVIQQIAAIVHARDGGGGAEPPPVNPNA
jgi:hypothetical protein